LNNAERLRRLKESFSIIEALWTGDEVSFQGEFFSLKSAQQALQPLTSIPIVIGGVSDAILEIVRDHATWWNLPLPARGKLRQLLELKGTAQPSVQQMITYVISVAKRSTVKVIAARRFGEFVEGGPPSLNAEEAREFFGGLNC